MVVLGLGLGMVMQVLVLAVQNSVDYRMLGVATSGSTLFRQIGGSIGVAAFGAIFANRLGSEFAARLPGAQDPGRDEPGGRPAAAARRSTRPTSTRSRRRSSLSFSSAMAITFLAFLLTWLLRELPLRSTTTTA